MSLSESSPLPMLEIGSYQISRLLAGSNTLNGGSHLSQLVNQQMKRFFSVDRVIEHLQDCFDQGINTWQSVAANLDWYARLRQAGIPIQFLSLAHDDPQEPDLLPRLSAAGAIAAAYHGEFTDIAFKEGNLGPVRGYCRRIRDHGLLAGVSTHMPQVMEQILEEDWDVDFFMCCVYERHRSREQLLNLLGHVPIPVGEVYLEDDPPRMYQMMRSTDKPCLAFKILAAGRLCDRQEWVEQAFQNAFSQIKPNDGIIVGMYPEYDDQVALNAGYVRKFSHLSRPDSR